jgi:hypothetical protein
MMQLQLQLSSSKKLTLGQENVPTVPEIQPKGGLRLAGGLAS